MLARSVLAESLGDPAALLVVVTAAGVVAVGGATVVSDSESVAAAVAASCCECVAVRLASGSAWHQADYDAVAPVPS